MRSKSVTIFQGSGDPPQILGHRLLPEEELGAHALDLPLHVVDLLPVQGEHLGL